MVMCDPRPLNRTQPLVSMVSTCRWGYTGDSRIVTPIEHPYLKSCHGDSSATSLIPRRMNPYQSNDNQVVIQKQPLTGHLSGKQSETNRQRGQGKCKDQRHLDGSAELFIRVFKVARHPRVAGLVLNRRHDTRMRWMQRIWNHETKDLESFAT